MWQVHVVSTALAVACVHLYLIKDSIRRDDPSISIYAWDRSLVLLKFWLTLWRREGAVQGLANMSLGIPEDAATVLEQFVHDGMLSPLVPHPPVHVLFKHTCNYLSKLTFAISRQHSCRDHTLARRDTS